LQGAWMLWGHCRQRSAAPGKEELLVIHQEAAESGDFVGEIAYPVGIDHRGPNGNPHDDMTQGDFVVECLVRAKFAILPDHGGLGRACTTHTRRCISAIKIVRWASVAPEYRVRARFTKIASVRHSALTSPRREHNTLRRRGPRKANPGAPQPTGAARLVRHCRLPPHMRSK
jgi:hypothetical protein